MSEERWINLDGHYINMSKILAVYPIRKWNSTFASKDHIVAGRYCLQMHLDGEMLSIPFNTEQDALNAHTRLLEELGANQSTSIGDTSSSSSSSSSSSD